MEASPALSRIGLAGLAVMGQNLALNVAEKGFPIFVYNRTTSKVDETVQRAQDEGQLPLFGHYSPRDFVLSIQRLRSVVIFSQSRLTRRSNHFRFIRLHGTRRLHHRWW